MNVFYDANVLYDAGTKAMQGSKWKYETQMFEMNHLLETAHIREQLKTGYSPSVGNRFVMRERGKVRYITSSSTHDKTVAHVLCDEVITPAIRKYLQYDNSASQKGKGVDFHRHRLEAHLHQYYAREKTNEGYILLIDFSGYYANLLHRKCVEILDRFLCLEKLEPETLSIAKNLVENFLKTFALDVSRFSDAEIAEMYRTKVDPMMNLHVPAAQLTGKKMLAKGVDIGSQSSQDIGIVYPYRIDDFIKIVSAIKEYGRYTDDFYLIHRDKQHLEHILAGICQIAAEYGLIVNDKKTRICKLSEPFRHLQIQYALTDTGRVIRKIHPKSVTRERRKIKAYKRQLDAGKMTYEEIENSVKSWIGSNWKYMSKQQIKNMSRLYFDLFGRSIEWKRKHGRLRWLMAL